MQNRIAALEAIKRQGVRLAHTIARGDGHEWERKLQRGVRATEEHIAKHSGVCLGIAFSIGVLLGWVLKRR